MTSISQSGNRTPGDFTADQSSYVIREMFPPRPWINMLWNERLLAMVNQFGCGESWHKDEHGVQTALCSGPENRLVYLRDRQDATYWAANRNFRNEPFDEFFTEVGQGYQTVVSRYRGIRVLFTVFVPAQGAWEGWTVTLENLRPQRATLSLFTYAGTAINRYPFNAYKHGSFDNALNGVVLTCRPAKCESSLTSMFLAADRTVTAWETTDRRFAGTYGSLIAPAALAAERLACEATCFDKTLCAVLQHDVALSPGESTTWCFMAGLATEAQGARDLCTGTLARETFDRELASQRREALALTTRLVIKTPDRELDALTNVWLKRQINLGKTWARGGGRGFRDVMQDTAAFTGLDPDTAAERILHCLRYQKEDGNTLRQWDPPMLHPYRDGAVWIAPTLTAYLKETGDFGLLERQAPYYGSSAQGTVLEHTLRGMRFLFDGLGAHGLCLWGGGDWNDSIDTAGLKGYGESVWLSEATIASAQELTVLLDRLGMTGEAAELRQRAAFLRDNISRHAWEDDHFICGFNDAGQRIGSYDNREGRLFLNPQTWAVLAGVASDPEALMDLVERELSCSFGYVLNKPAYSARDDGIGRVTYMEKGCYENGAVYNHGVAFKIAADCRLGRGQHAYDTVKRMLGSNPANPSLQSGVEPYAVTNMYLGPENTSRAGQSVVPWFTGTAGWLYRCIVEMILGVQAEYDGLRIAPCLPAEWNSVSIRRRYRNTLYRITIQNPLGLQTGQVKMRMDGQNYNTALLPVIDDGQEHTVQAELRPL